MNLTGQQRDLNEPDIIEALEKVGASTILMDKSAGFDLIVIYDQVHITEIKNPEYAPKNGKVEKMLTLNEKLTKEIVEAAGGEYNIILTTDQALEMIGIEYE